MVQPIGAPIDFSKSVEELMLETEALVRGAGALVTRGEWQEAISQKLSSLDRS